MILSCKPSDYAALMDVTCKIDAKPPADFSPVLSAIASIDVRPVVNLQPVLDEFPKLNDTLLKADEDSELVIETISKTQETVLEAIQSTYDGLHSCIRNGRHAGTGSASNSGNVSFGGLHTDRSGSQRLREASWGRNWFKTRAQQ